MEKSLAEYVTEYRTLSQNGLETAEESERQRLMQLLAEEKAKLKNEVSRN